MDRSSRAFMLRGLFYAFVFVSGCMQVAVVPLLPAYTHRFDLSHTEQGLLLACTGIATLAVALPSGALADRFGAKRVTIWAGWLMAGAAVVEALAPTFSLLLIARLVFGAGYGVTWTAGLSWLSEGSPKASSIGGSVAVGGMGNVIGPALFGVLGEYFGLSVPFVGAGLAFAAVTAALCLVRLPTPEPVAPAPVRASLRLAAADCRTVVATAAIVVAGLTSGVAYLLVPDELHAAGASTAVIGLAFSVAGAIFVIGSVLTAASGRRAVRLRFALVGMLVLALTVTPAAASAAPVALLAMLCASSGSRSVLWTVAYPLGGLGAERSGAGIGLVMGFLNGVWAATAVVSPLLAGVVAQHLGDEMSFGLIELLSVAFLGMTGAYALRARREAIASGDRARLHGDLGCALDPGSAGVGGLS